MTKELEALKKLEQAVKEKENSFPHCPQEWNDILKVLKEVEVARQEAAKNLWSGNNLGNISGNSTYSTTGYTNNYTAAYTNTATGSFFGYPTNYTITYSTK